MTEINRERDSAVVATFTDNIGVYRPIYTRVELSERARMKETNKSLSVQDSPSQMSFNILGVCVYVYSIRNALSMLSTERNIDSKSAVEKLTNTNCVAI